MTEFIFKLFDRPSFLDGMARVLDLSGSLNIYNNSHSAAEADMKAIRSDWEVVGKDLGDTIEFERQKKSSAPKSK